jgi:hypothetical protein
MNASSSLDERFAPALTSLGESAHPDAAAIKQQLLEAIAAAPSSTMAQWCKDHDGQTVHTIQIDNKTGEVWAPMGRVLDAHSYATKALFDGSTREYAGMRVLATTGDALIVAADWHTVAYLLAG